MYIPSLQNRRTKASHFAAGIAFFIAFTSSAFSFANGALPAQPSDLRTPEPSAAPHLNGPKIYGARPGHPFLYRIPCTGELPISYSAVHLPASLKLDRRTGIISGAAPHAVGRYIVTLEAANERGKSARSFTIVVGQQIGLTPQMGWNDWYTYYGHVTDQDIRAAAAAMVSSGLANYGYQYVDIDDTWARKPGSDDAGIGGDVRDAKGNLRTNARFPDMNALTGYIHSLGLKAGIYTSPGPLTCAKYAGSYQHENTDAHQFAAWGFDLLKYDWCSYGKVAPGKSLEDLQAPYKRMGQILEQLDRDIVFNMCQYGMGDVWKWGREVGGNSWRTTGDLGMERNTSLPGFYRIGLANAGLSEYAGNGGWNDPDYILIGTVGDPMTPDLPPHASTLTHEEQYSYMSMWSLMAAPLLFSGDMTRLDKFTLNVLCNSEVIDIDQDSLGKQARVVKKSNDELILEKPLEDGSVAVGLFNLANEPRALSGDWAELDLEGRQTVRDVWRQRNIGVFEGSFSSITPAHGVILIRLMAGLH